LNIFIDENQLVLRCFQGKLVQLSRNRLLDFAGFCVVMSMSMDGAVMVVWEARCENVPPLTWNGEGCLRLLISTVPNCEAFQSHEN